MICRLPVDKSFEHVGLKVEILEPFCRDQIQEFHPNIYEVSEIKIEGQSKAWYLATIQNHYDYPFQNGSKYRELVDYIVDNLNELKNIA